MRPHLNLAALYIQVSDNNADKLKKAEDILAVIVRIAPQKMETHDLLSQLYVRQQKWQQAKEELDILLHFNSRLYEVYFRLGIVNIYLENFNEAQKDFTQSLAEGRIYNFFDYINIARIYEVHGRINEAIENYQQARQTPLGLTPEGIDFVNHRLYELYKTTGDVENMKIFETKI